VEIAKVTLSRNRLTDTMKKSLFALLLLVLLMASFRGGFWYSQRWTRGNHEFGAERRILHYVDPMNPTNVSDKPGIAPCGMPMEPVYDNGDAPGSLFTDDGKAMPPGTVKISSQKQQIIGIQVGTAERVSETHGIRTLGRIAADGNRVYPLISAADGWMSYIPGSTIGSLVNKDQLMALIKIYSYDFFSWQQRYLTELANTGQRRHPDTNISGLSGARYSMAMPGRSPTVAMPQPEAKSVTDNLNPNLQTEKIPRALAQPEQSSSDMSSPGTTQDNTQPSENRSSLSMPFSAMKSRLIRSAAPQPDMHPAQTPQSVEKQPAAGHMSDQTMHEEAETHTDSSALEIMGEDDILYTNKGKLELLNLGIRGPQLDELARTGIYVTTIEVRSPATGLVIDRSVSPLQKVDRGTECFRVADLSRVWILADVFNAEARFIRPGMIARINLPLQSTYLEARVSDVLPQFDAKTRALKVRLEMDNPEYAFLPDMFVDVEFKVSLPPAVTVPADAVMDTGRRKIVFISLGNGYFEPRDVVTGWRFTDRVEIVKGLAAGEQIVVSGNFLIDSESRMKLAATDLMSKSGKESGSPDNVKSDAPGQGEPRHD
jgi:hypothetical protein